MKKLISYIMLAAASLVFFACSPKSAPTIQDAANAAPANADIFVAVDINKSLQEKSLAQKGAKEYTNAFIGHPEMQQFLDIVFQGAPENLKPIFSAKAVADLTMEYMQNPEDFFFAMAATDWNQNSFDVKFMLLKHSLCVQKIKEMLEQEKDFEKSQKDNLIFFKIKGETPATIAIDGALLVIADDENAALEVMNNLKTKKEGSFASTENFKKLMSLEKDPILAGFANFKNITEDNFGNAFVAMSAESVNKGSGVAKIEFGKNAFDGDEKAAKTWGAICKNKLAKRSMLKNSMQNATFAIAAALPEITSDIEKDVLSDIIGSDPESQKIIAALKSAGLKNLFFSAGALDAKIIAGNNENGEVPEAFLKIEAADTDAIFKNEMLAQLINSPMFLPSKLGSDTVYESGMYNLKLAQISKTCAAISTIKDIKKMMSLAKGSGKSLADIKDAKAIVCALPEGNNLELFMDVKALMEFSEAINANFYGPDQNFADKIDKISSQICKKALFALGVKFEPKEITINFKVEGEYDYELGAKLLKEMK